MGYLRKIYAVLQYDPTSKFFGFLRVKHPELYNDPTPEPAISSYILSEEQINEITAMKMDLGVKIVQMKLAIANKIGGMLASGPEPQPSYPELISGRMSAIYQYKMLSQEQINELAAMEMDLQVEIAEKELAIANKARGMMRNSMGTK